MTERPYRPSSGTEGIDFMDQWCDRCWRDAAFQSGEGDSCPIAAASMVYDISDADYPREWIIGDDGRPCCTAFEAVQQDGAIHDGRQKEMFRDG